MERVVRIRDFFAGYAVRVMPVHGRWLVEFVRADGSVESAQTYVSMQGALEGIEEHLHTLSDEAPIRERTDDASRHELMAFVQETTARRSQGESPDTSSEVGEVIARDQWREWLERQMGSAD